jgi:nitrous oxide reductase accessory protein NosL
MNKKILFAIPMSLAILAGCSAETDKEQEPPVEDTNNEVEDENFKLDQEESDGDENN